MCLLGSASVALCGWRWSVISSCLSLYSRFFGLHLLGLIYLAGIAVVAALLIYEHWLVRPDDLTRVNQAFFQINGVISIGLFLVILLQLAIPL